jgi:hypothetical protein
MNICIIVVLLLAIINSSFARVEVVSVTMGFTGHGHAIDITKVINSKEAKGAIFFHSTVFNSITYLYFRWK